jgi:UrcA family protein
MNRKWNITMSAFVLGAVFGLSAPGFGQTPNFAVASRIVRYGDLDLSTSAGIQTLYERIQNAAWHVCERVMLDHGSTSAIDSIKCRKASVAAAVANVNKPALTALATGKAPVEWRQAASLP